jgi:hypothetical protein
VEKTSGGKCRLGYVIRWLDFLDMCLGDYYRGCCLLLRKDPELRRARLRRREVGGSLRGSQVLESFADQPVLVESLDIG